MFLEYWHIDIVMFSIVEASVLEHFNDRFFVPEIGNIREILCDAWVKNIDLIFDWMTSLCRRG